MRVKWLLCIVMLEDDMNDLAASRFVDPASVPAGDTWLSALRYVTPSVTMETPAWWPWLQLVIIINWWQWMNSNQDTALCFVALSKWTPWVIIWDWMSSVWAAWMLSPKVFTDCCIYLANSNKLLVPFLPVSPLLYTPGLDQVDLHSDFTMDSAEIPT